MPRYDFAPQRRRRSRLPIILILILVLLVGGAIWLSTLDTAVETTTIEQDVTNDLQAQ